MLKGLLSWISQQDHQEVHPIGTKYFHLVNQNKGNTRYEEGDLYCNAWEHVLDGTLWVNIFHMLAWQSTLLVWAWQWSASFLGGLHFRELTIPGSHFLIRINGECKPLLSVKLHPSSVYPAPCALFSSKFFQWSVCTTMNGRGISRLWEDFRSRIGQDRHGLSPRVRESSAFKPSLWALNTVFWVWLKWRNIFVIYSGVNISYKGFIPWRKNRRMQPV